MASAEREPITGVWDSGAEPAAGSKGRAPRQGQSPSSGGQGRSLLEAESFEAFAHLNNAQKFAVSMPSL